MARATKAKAPGAKSKAKKPASKPAAGGPMTAAAKRAAAANAAPVVVDTPQPVVSGPVMRKRELIDAVVAQSGIKKKDAKPVVEAMLAVLGSALQDGRELNLQPMGKFKINREKKKATGKVLKVHVRQAKDLPPSVAQEDAVMEGQPVVTATAKVAD
ncbi:MAG: HU family DNA-binding protein [Pseudomonadota bacterium]